MPIFIRPGWSCRALCRSPETLVRRGNALQELRLVSGRARRARDGREILWQALAAIAALVGKDERVALSHSGVEQPQLAELVVVDADGLRDPVELVAERHLRRQERVLHVLAQLCRLGCRLTDDDVRAVDRLPLADDLLRRL